MLSFTQTLLTLLPAQLPHQHRPVFDQVLAAIENPQNNGDTMYFLYAAAGCGKAYLYKVLAAKLRSEGQVVVCVASSGAASLLLPGGSTAHGRFKIPLTCTDPGEVAFCDIKKGRNSILADCLRLTDLIIWDEATLMDKKVFETVDRSLRDIIGVDKPFGGIVTLFGGDWAQCLPVVTTTGGSLKASTLDAVLQRSYLWQSTKQLTLTDNMRVRPEDAEYAKFLLEISRKDAQDVVSFPRYLSKFYNRKRFIDDIITPSWLADPDSSRAILAFITQVLIQSMITLIRSWTLRRRSTLV